jgi:hypothetical protein
MGPDKSACVELSGIFGRFGSFRRSSLSRVPFWEAPKRDESSDRPSVHRPATVLESTLSARVSARV